MCVCAVCAFVCFGLFSVYLCVPTAHRHFPLLKWLLIDKKQKKERKKETHRKNGITHTPWWLCSNAESADSKRTERRRRH